MHFVGRLALCPSQIAIQEVVCRSEARGCSNSYLCHLKYQSCNSIGTVHHHYCEAQ